jgi:integrase
VVVIPSNPAAGGGPPRAPRAERLSPTGRALDDNELPVLWRAANEAGWPFGPYLKLLLLLGQRRTETALMRWADLDLEAGCWSIPPETAKSGRPHRVPLPDEAIALLRGVPLTTAPYVFAGRGGCAMSGWSKRLRPVYVATAARGMAPWSLHDLRRTFRSGLAALGVDHVIAELMLGHTVPGGTLAPIYDRAERWPERVEAGRLWSVHVMRTVKSAKVVPLRRATS